jgi:hypothetical protein
MKCPTGFVCYKSIPGSFMGSCVKGGPNSAAAKEAAATCDQRTSKDTCAKSDLCAWADKEESCSTRCELRKSLEICERTDQCAWMEKAANSVTKCNTRRSREPCAKDERCVWLDKYDYCLTRPTDTRPTLEKVPRKR